MKITTGNLGLASYAFETSFHYLGFEMILPPLTNSLSQELGEKSLRAELCHPLKLLLGNFLILKDEKPDIVIFYNGCDLCNLTPINNIYLEVFEKYSWHPEAYYMDITRKSYFLRDYYNNLRKITGAPAHKIIKAISLGLSKLQLFQYLDDVFCMIRPTIKVFNLGESIYSKLFQEIVNARDFSEYKRIKRDINELLKLYPPDHNCLHFGLTGDPFSLREPYSHQFTDRKLGYMGVIVDKFNNNLIKKKMNSKKVEIKDFIKNNHGVFTNNAIARINNYTNKAYDGIVFISPFNCTPNDSLRNQLGMIQEKTGMPMLSLIFDSHTCSTGLQSRLEAFIDMVYRKKNIIPICNQL
jgi:predicted nucleotide-binding protein (sugar kinase/HSP70/actin superfamily)